MKLKKGGYHAAVNLICLILLPGSAIYLTLNWGEIPDQVPAHYNASGIIDRWGSKSEFLILLALHMFGDGGNRPVSVGLERRRSCYCEKQRTGIYHPEKHTWHITASACGSFLFSYDQFLAAQCTSHLVSTFLSVLGIRLHHFFQCKISTAR